MKRQLAVGVAVMTLTNGFAAETTPRRVHALSPATLAVRVDPGSAVFPDGTSVSFKGAELTFAPPEVVATTVVGKTPANHDEMWGEQLALKPKVDTLILGSLWCAVLPESVVVSREGKRLKRDEDYTLNELQGQVANLDDKLGRKGEGEISVDCKYVTQRLDLLQVGRDGRLSVKKGESVVVCPMLPMPDADCAGVAGVYIYTANHPWQFVVSDEDIFEIRPVAPVAPINKNAVERIRAKLTAKQKVSIAFVGDSITLGAEAGEWWSDRSKTYTGLVVSGITNRYGVKVKQIPAFSGGENSRNGIERFEKEVLPKKPDLAIVAYGINDVGYSGMSEDEFKSNMLTLVTQAKAAGIEVILVTPLHPSGFSKNSYASRMPAYIKKLIEIGDEQGVGVADVYTEWANMAWKGIPPYSQLHNWSNHPGPYGMSVYANVILRFFE